MTDKSSTFVVMTFNVGNGLAPGPRLLRYLRSVSADVIGLQEVSPAQAEILDEGLADLYPYRIVSGSGFSGRAFLSRHPIVSHTWIPIEPDRPDLQARVDIDGHEVTFLVVHPAPPKPGRSGMVFDSTTQQQIRDTAEITIQARPAVLLGDFNMTIRNPAYQWLTHLGLTDAYVLAGNRGGRTFPLRIGRSRRVNHRLSWMPLRPVARVDYIWHTSDITPFDAWLGEDAGSDHLPVLARLSLSN